jgi:hypothetical protein
MWRRFFSHPWCIPLLALLGMLIAAPTFNVGLIGDDYIHRSLLIGETSHPHTGSFFGLFTFVDGQPSHIQALKEAGRVQWWAADHLKLSFWRPLTELTQWLDYRLWPDTSVMLHLHSICWYGLLVYLLGRLYRMLDDDPVRTGLATLIFAVSSLHLFIVAWLAARNQLVAACFAVTTIMAYHQWRSQRSALHGALAMLTLILGLLSAEAAIATVGYLAAYALVYEQDRPWPRRVLALLPFLVIVVAWRVGYTRMGYGSSGSGAYIDPGASLPRFGLALLMRLPTLLLAQLFGASAAVTNELPYHAKLLYAGGAGVVVLLCVGVGRYFGLWASRQARFFALGALFALVPVCAAEPSDRLLLNAEIGLSAVFAALFTCFMATRRQHTGKVAWGAKGVTVMLMFVHLVAFPLMSVSMALVLSRITKPTTHDEPLSLPDAAPGSSQHVILLNPPAPMLLYYFPAIRSYFGLHNPASIQALAAGIQGFTLNVLDAHTIRLSGPRFGDSMSRDFHALPFKVGDTVHAGNFDVTIEAVTPEGMASVARFRFAAPLSDASLGFYAWGENGGYVPFALPAIGHSIAVPKVDLSKMVKRALSGK